jgi:DNA-directed RNA polymerase specialized sigma24 family protein
VMRMAYHKSIDLRRQNVVRQGTGMAPARHSAVIDKATPESLASEKDHEEFLLGRLYNDYQREIASRRLLQFTNEEIAADLNVDVRYVERTMARVRKKVALRLEKPGE